MAQAHEHCKSRTNSNLSKLHWEDVNLLKKQARKVHVTCTETPSLLPPALCVCMNKEKLPTVLNNATSAIAAVSYST
jgi:hypothetical protein